MDKRFFSFENQEDFSRLSGDWNPLHIDPTYARRSLNGEIVVHGIHALLWVMDRWTAKRGHPIQILSLRADFLRPIALNAEIHVQERNEPGNVAVFKLYVSGSEVSTVELQWAAVDRPSRLPHMPISNTEKSAPIDLPVKEMEAAKGDLALGFNRELQNKLFPALSQFLSDQELATILSTSRLVGMECPGLNSIFSSLRLSRSEQANHGGIEYQVERLDGRFNLVTMAISAPNFHGKVKAFVRPEPYRQIDYRTVSSKVPSREFSDQKALILGGSRGLGEISAKILAAGGAEVVLTYSKGREDAEKITRDIVAGGGKATYLHFDIENIDSNQNYSQQKITHLYYFATPFIFSGKKALFSRDLFDKFCFYYVSGFSKTVNVFKGSLKAIFYPSSVALDQFPLDMVEYAAAKAAGEALCSSLENASQTLRVFKPRLPRTATDQTMSVLPTHNEDGFEVMLNLLRQFNRIS